MDLIKDSLNSSVMWFTKTLNWSSKLHIVVPLPKDIMGVFQPYLKGRKDTVYVPFRYVRQEFIKEQWDWIMVTPYFCSELWTGNKIGLEHDSAVEPQFVFNRIRWYHIL